MDEDDFDKDFKNEVENYVNNLEFENNFLPDPISLDELKHAIKTLKTYSSPGIDKVNNSLLKKLPDDFMEVILELFNQCLKKGEIPKNWKISKITMIPKKSDNKQDPLNYRPISLTSCICKFFEKIIRNRLQKFLEDRNLLANSQSGFRNFRRTSDNLFFLTQKVKEAFNRGNKICSLFFDIAKAFDRVWHDGLIYKMSKMGVPKEIIKISKSFLSNRLFFVDVEGEMSELYQIETGVPQGAVLSPIFFSIFINDIPLHNEQNQKYSMLFADDLATFFIYKSNKIQKAMQIYLNNLEKWLYKWRFKMAVSKCSYVIFAKKHDKKKDNFQLKMNGQFIPQSKETLFLGTILDHNLNFNSHIEHIKEKCIDRLNIIKILSYKSWKLSKKTLVNIYRALIGSLLDYSFFILTSISNKASKDLQATQNKAMRSIFNLKYDPTSKTLPSTETVREISGLQTVSIRMLEITFRFISKALINNLFIRQLVGEYKGCLSSIKRKNESLLTPLCLVAPSCLLLYDHYTMTTNYMYFL